MQTKYIIIKRSSANIVANPSMGNPAESIATMIATLQKGLVKAMSQKQFESEKMYQTSMQMFRSLLDKGVLTPSDYAEAERLMREKYHPAIGTLFFDLALT